MSHRFIWSIVAALSLGGLIAFLSQSSAQRPGGGPGGMPGMPGNPQHMPGRFVVANASAHQVLILDTATGQVYRAGERDFKSMSELPGAAGEARTPAREREPEPKMGVRPHVNRRSTNPDKKLDPVPEREIKRKEDARPDPNDQSETLPPPKGRDEAPPRREEK